MSQLPMEQPAGKAFAKTPNSAGYFREQYERAQGAAQPEGAQPSQGQQPMTVVAPPQGRLGYGAVPAPRTYQPDPAPQSPEPEPQAPQAAPAQDAELQRQLAAEREAFAQREQQWRQWAQEQDQRLAEARAAQAELDKMKSREALAQKLASDEAFAGLESVDAEDARKIIGLTAEAIQEPLNATAQQLKELREQNAQMRQYIDQQGAAMRSQRVRDELLSAHPDFFELYERNPQFRQFLAQRDGLSYQTREERAIAEYNAGNAPYLIEMINQFKGRSPDVNNIKTVAPVQVANAAAPYQQPQARPRYTLADLNYFMQTGQISPDQYKEELNKLRAAQPV